MNVRVMVKIFKNIAGVRVFLLTSIPEERALWEKVSWRSLMLIGCFTKIQKSNRKESSSF